MEHLIKLAMDWSEVTLLNSLATACLHRTEALGWRRFINKVQKEPDNSKKKTAICPVHTGKPQWFSFFTLL